MTEINCSKVIRLIIPLLSYFAINDLSQPVYLLQPKTIVWKRGLGMHALMWHSPQIFWYR